MNIEELTQKLKNKEITYTIEETKEILIKAKVLMPDGTYNPEMFSEDLVKRSRIAVREKIEK